MSKFRFYDLRERTSHDSINFLFPHWEFSEERLAIFGAHDDDSILGAGYAMAAAMEASAEVFVVTFCKGDCGYSAPEQKDSIVEIRRAEHESALIKFGIKKENIKRFEYPDFSLGQFLGKELQNGDDGTFLQVLDFIREKRITRVMMHNNYREHTDHTAVYEIVISDVIQAGDAILADRGNPQHVKSYHQYSVWADFSPEDALTNNESNCFIRANRAIVCDETIEEKVRLAICEYASQGQIIDNLLISREERRVFGGYVELYIELDPRPKLDFAPYVRLINEMNTKEKRILL